MKCSRTASQTSVETQDPACHRHRDCCHYRCRFVNHHHSTAVLPHCCIAKTQPTIPSAPLQRLYSRVSRFQLWSWIKRIKPYSQTYTHNRLMALRAGDYQGGPVPEETFTNSQPSWSSNILYQLPTIHSILLVHCTCLAVLFHNVSPGPLWPSSWSGNICFILHTFLHPTTSEI